MACCGDERGDAAATSLLVRARGLAGRAELSGDPWRLAGMTPTGAPQPGGGLARHAVVARLPMLAGPEMAAQARPEQDQDPHHHPSGGQAVAANPRAARAMGARLERDDADVALR